jgi:hypothetical protein
MVGGIGQRTVPRRTSLFADPLQDGNRLQTVTSVAGVCDWDHKIEPTQHGQTNSSGHRRDPLLRAIFRSFLGFGSIAPGTNYQADRWTFWLMLFGLLAPRLRFGGGCGVPFL